MRGLSSHEVLQKRAQGLGNPPPPPTGRTYAQILRENVFTFINGVIFILGAALFLVGRPIDALLSVGIISLNVLVSVVQEIRAKRTLDRIALLTRPKATVIRSGARVQVFPEELVVGDILYVAPGDQIVLDGQVVEGKMQVDESPLTGESDLIAKQKGDAVYSGSFCVTGSAFYIAQKVGSDSLANQITAGARAFRRVLTPLQEQISLVVRIMLLIVIYLEFLIALNALLKSLNLGETIQQSTLIAGLVPNGLFLSISIAYAFGAVRILRFGVLVQQANAIESLSNVNILCLDKTGTLTTNRLQLHGLHPLTVSQEEFARILGDMVANATAHNKTSEAIAEKIRGEPRAVVGEIPFSSARKWSAIAFGAEEKGVATEVNNSQSSVLSAHHFGIFALGAPEILQPYLGEMGDPEAPQWRAIAIETRQLADQGLRVLLVTHHPSAALQDNGDASELPQGMTPLGLVSLSDELRPEARQALQDFIRAGVNPKIISGDSPETVAALAKQAGLKNVALVSGIELAKMSAAQFREAAKTANVFGRITPQQKQKLVQTLRAEGYYVAMIGDGVNDVLSLKQANLGIALQSGTQATRAVADLVLMQDSFAALAPAVSEGQRIVNGMQDILKLFMTRIATMALVIVSALVIGEFPLVLRQASLITLFSVGIPTVLLAVWARPGAVGRDTLGRRLFHFVLTPVVVTTIFALLLFYGTLAGELALRLGFTTNLTRETVTPYYPEAVSTAQSTLVAFLVLVGLLTIIFVEPPTEWWTGGDPLSGDWKPTLLAIWLMVIFFVIVFIKPARNVFAVHALGALELSIAIATTIVWLFLVRWLWRQRVLEKYLDIRESAH
jgi:cation-transporting ATPase E